MQTVLLEAWTATAERVTEPDPPAVRVIVFEPEDVVTGRLAAHALLGAAMASAGVAMAGAAVASFKRGNPNVAEMAVVNSVSKFFPVLLSSPLEKLTLASHTQFRNPPAEARIVSVR